jgi:hypothetical protein
VRSLVVKRFTLHTEVEGASALGSMQNDSLHLRFTIIRERQVTKSLEVNAL